VSIDVICPETLLSEIENNKIEKNNFMIISIGCCYA
jgi:hypothetical protein